LFFLNPHATGRIINILEVDCILLISVLVMAN
jgi:hypothetical protein